MKTKKWNPYCIRHSAITADSDFLPEYALKKKVRWSMNSKQGARYIKRRMGNDLKQKILAENGIFLERDEMKKTSVLTCPRCSLVNAMENKVCSKCAYPLTASAYEEIKVAENKDYQDLKTQVDSMKFQMQNILSILTSLNHEGKQELAKMLIDGGIYRARE